MYHFKKKKISISGPLCYEWLTKLISSEEIILNIKCLSRLEDQVIEYHSIALEKLYPTSFESEVI